MRTFKTITWEIGYFGRLVIFTLVTCTGRPATFFRGNWSWNNFYGHSLPSADSRRAVVSYWRKNVH